ncbi:MAG: lipopolysaccharide/colanic/teichoic acid biosynthesis glycosyltransferase [Polaribacter sp.]|jgi:lipopolysaccharide/colanic/teichoic acid biosynthesis glycosyltransferase
MSLIGPRPLLIKYLLVYNEEQKKRHLIKPGITGWAQVNGRNAISWEAKFEYDIWYVKNISLILDVKILFLTIYKVFKKDGIYSVDNDIVPDFTGTKTNN